MNEVMLNGDLLVVRPILWCAHATFQDEKMYDEACVAEVLEVCDGGGGWPLCEAMREYERLALSVQPRAQKLNHDGQ